MTNTANHDRKAVVDALNSLEILEENSGEDGYLLVKNSDENRKVLNDVGITDETIRKYGDDDTFCVLALGFGEKYVDHYDGSKLQCFDDSVEFIMSREKEQSVLFYKQDGKVFLTLYDQTNVLVSELTDEMKQSLLGILS